MLPDIWKSRGSLYGPSVNEFVDRLFYGWPAYDQDKARAWSPRADVYENDGKVFLDVELPGLDKNDIKVEVKNNTLTISGERVSQRATEDSQCNCSERIYGKFERSFELSDTVESDKVSAEFKNGILTLTLPKAEKAKAKEIKVEVK